MRKQFVILFSLAVLLVSCDRLGKKIFDDSSSVHRIAPSVALNRLEQGNKRYQKEVSDHPKDFSARRFEVSETQAPFAIVVGCSDSRVPPEIIFDQGLGDIFVVRVAGQVVGPIELDSIEYAAKYLGASLVVVLGHENCGAVKAVLDHKTKDIEDVAQLIENAIGNAKGLSVDEAVKTNVQYVVNQLKNSAVVSQMIASDQLNVVGGFYYLGSGQVEFLP